MARQSTIGTLLYVLLGPIAWAFHVTVIYGGQSLLCTIAGTEAAAGMPIMLVIAAATITAAAIVGASAVRPERIATALGAGDWPDPSRHFQRRVMTLLAILSLFGIVAGGATALFLPACAALR